MAKPPGKRSPRKHGARTDAKRSGDPGPLVDPEAVAAALENVRLNALEEVIWVEATPLPALRQQFALILANLTAADLAHWAEALAGRTLPGGALIISGFLTQDMPAVISRFAQYGLTETGCLSQEDWCVLILRRL